MAEASPLFVRAAVRAFGPSTGKEFVPILWTLLRQGFEKLLGSRSQQPHHSIEMATNRVAGANWLLPRIDTQNFRHFFYAGFVEPRFQELQIDGLMLSIVSS
ncbi:hypothetical protein ACFSQQ_40560 [Mesorhizobium kowhaii]|uniref:hypothetical protein n=1 Tax=Mesorhizobium kowhaii TaxID=1300272 RepID=UPI0035E48884